MKQEIQKGQIVAGALAPHPPHLVYAENPPQNEPHSECGWEVLRWGYDKLRKNLDALNYDVLIIQSPHWRTHVGTHFINVPKLQSLSVDPIFPNLFRFHYNIHFDQDLTVEIEKEARQSGLVTQMVTNKHFRVDYGTIVSAHMTNPKWDKPIVSISSNGGAHYFNFDVMQSKMYKLGQATKRAVEASGKRAVLLASHSLSHRHFVTEPELPEDMSYERIHHHGQYIWDMRLIDLMKKGKTKEMVEVLPEFREHTNGEVDGGGLSWMMSAMDFPKYSAEIHAYGTVIGTGNVVAEWNHTANNQLTTQIDNIIKKNYKKNDKKRTTRSLYNE